MSQKYKNFSPAAPQFSICKFFYLCPPRKYKKVKFFLPVPPPPKKIPGAIPAKVDCLLFIQLNGLTLKKGFAIISTQRFWTNSKRHSIPLAWFTHKSTPSLHSARQKTTTKFVNIFSTFSPTKCNLSRRTPSEEIRP